MLLRSALSLFVYAPYALNSLALCGLLAGSAFSQNYTLTTLAGGAVPNNIPGTAASLGQIYSVAADPGGNLFFPVNGYYALLRLDAGTRMLTKIAGTGVKSETGDGGAATVAAFGDSCGVAIDPGGNVYFSEANRVRMISRGIISTVVGNGTTGFSGDGGPATAAQLNSPCGLAFDSSGNLYIADTGNNRIRKFSGGVITSVAGNGSPSGAAVNGPALSASITNPVGIAVDAVGSLYIADWAYGRIFKVSNGTLSVVAGTQEWGFGGDGGPPLQARFSRNYGVAVDGQGNIFVADTGNNRIRKISNGVVTTIAGTGTAGFSGDGGAATSAQLNGPTAVSVDTSGNIIVADTGNAVIRAISSGVITTVAGGGNSIGDNAAGAMLDEPTDVRVDAAGNLFVADSFNNRVRKFSNGMVSTVAGSGSPNLSGDGGPAMNAGIPAPPGLSLDSGGDIYVVDGANGLVRKVANGDISTVAGGGARVGENVAATTVSLPGPVNVAADSSGNVYIATGDFQIHKVANGVITTFAGTGAQGYSGDGGPATSATLGASASFNAQGGIAVDSSGNLYIADFGNNAVRRVSNGIITTVAGNGTAGFSGDNGPATSAELNGPTGVAVDSAGNLYIADFNNNRIRKVANGNITTIAGTGVNGCDAGGPALSFRVTLPRAIAVDAAGNLYIADWFCARVLRVVNGVVSIFAGSGNPGFADGPAAQARFRYNYGVAVDAQGNVYVADSANERIRMISKGVVNTLVGNGNAGFSGDNGPATNGELNSPTGVGVDSLGNLYIADFGNNVVRKVANGIITTIAGGGTATNGGSATGAFLNGPTGVAIDPVGNAYVADTGNHRVLKVSGGVYSTVAGNGSAGYSGDSGPATSAQLHSPTYLALDSAGAVYISDSGNHAIRKVANGSITTVAGTGTPGYDNDNVPAISAKLNSPSGLAVDGSGNIYIADTNNQRIRKVSPDGTITTIAGIGLAGLQGDNGPAQSAKVNYPGGIALDAAGNLYIADKYNNRIRILTLSSTPVAVSLSPYLAAAGRSAFKLTVNGTGFVSGSTIQWNGSALATTFVSVNQVTATVAASLVANPGSATVTVLNPGGAASFPMLFATSQLAIAAATMPQGVIGTPYSASITGSGGAPPYSNWVLNSGSLPPGLTLDASTGAIHGIPTSSAAIPYAFTVIMKDTSGVTTVPQQFSILTTAPSSLAIVSAAALPPGTVGVAYGESLSAIAGTPPYQWNVTEGNLPPGITLTNAAASAALLAGSPSAAGTYTFSVQVTDSANANVTRQFTVTINPPGSVFVYSGGVVNAASYLGGSVAPGEMVTIFGSGTGPDMLAGLQVLSSGKLATTIAGVQVLFDGVPAPLIYVSSTQVSCVVPYEVSGKSSTTMQVVFQNQNSNGVTLPVTVAAPGIFTADSSGSGGGAILNQDGSLNSPSNPAAVGSVIVVYATGEGQTTPTGADGQLGGSSPPKPQQMVAATVSKTPAKVLYAGGAYGLVAGVMQVNIQLPASVPTGDAVPFTLNVGGATSQVVTVAVR
jgi:uncharacterized protein (TIGR03437 family)